jgi:Tfp pilus assembly protein PilX
MKHYLPKSKEDGAALIVTLLIVVLLATISVSFFSTARIEQTATRNYTSKTQAEQFAILATQQAMAKLQAGFITSNATSGTGSTIHTQVVTTQPGQITKYFFLNGTCTGNATTALYTENGTASADMNNLQNPGNTTQVRANVSENQAFTITGNATNRLIVNMENVTSNGTLIGRIAYYVDDELTKINMNAATGNRTTLNVSTPRSNSLSALTSNTSSLTVTSPQITLFQNVIDGNANNSTNISNWSHFFRNEQLSPSTTFNATAAQLAQISTAPLSDFHLKYTPWGARRLHINDEPLNSTGVDNVYNALNSQFLRNIYGQTFNDKYGQPWSWTGNYGQTSNITVNGLKQTIANLLQMRTPGSHDIPTVTAGFTGAVISENGTSTFPPTGYYADIPSGCINEFGFQMIYTDYNAGAVKGILVYPTPIIEFMFPSYWPYGDPGIYLLEVTIQSLTFTVCDSLGNTANRTIGPLKLTRSNDLNNYAKRVTNGFFGSSVPPWIQLTSQINVFNNGNTPGLDGNNNLPWTIVGNPTLVMGDVKLYAGTTNSSAALRDWLTGSFINQRLGNGTSLNLNQPIKVSPPAFADNNSAQANLYGNQTLQRIDPRIKGEEAWVVAPYTFPRTGTTIFSDQSTNQSFKTDGGHNTFYGGYGLRPSETATRDIPGDPSPMGDNEPDYFIATEHSWIYLPRKLYTIDSYGNATFNTANDLGKVTTNVNWRRLRFMPRHQREAAKNLIPDWAMLDVISFSSNNSSSSNLKIAPINPNGAFAVDTNINNSTITPRNNIPALVKALESTSATDFQLGSALARTVSGSNMTFGKVDMRFEGTDFITFQGNTPFATSISGNITSNSTTKWSTTNSTWSAWRTANKWPATSLILPGEVTEIRGVADYGRRSQYQYDNSGTSGAKSIKENEGRLSAFFPGLTLQSNFFTIYAYAQAGRENPTTNQFEVDSEALTKTLVEVEITTPATSNGTSTTPAQYKVKKLYTQTIPLDQ